MAPPTTPEPGPEPSRRRAPGRRSARWWPLLAIAALVAVVASLAEPALAHDGAIRWRTLRSARVAVHHPADYEVFARLVAATAEDALTTLQPVLPYVQPRRLELTIDDYGDDSNGYAINFPYDHVHINAAPPRVGSDLEGNGDWVRALVFHEVAHILHMGQTDQVPAWVNRVLGRTYLPNALLPRFWLEGLATWVETRFVGHDRGVAGEGGGPARGGRVEGPVFLARLRAAALDDQWPSLETLTGSPLRWPRGRGWYVFGSWLLDVQARRYGAAKTAAFIAAYGRRVLPYALQSLYREVFGISARRMWQLAEADLRARLTQEQAWRAQALVPPALADDLTATTLPALATVVDLPIAGTEPEPGRVTTNAARAEELRPLLHQARVTRDGEWRGRVRPHPDGQSVVFARAPADDIARIERLWPLTGQRQVMHVCEADCDDAVVSPDGRWLLWTASRPHRLVYRRNEIFVAALGKDGRAQAPRQLTAGCRARELAIDPDGDLLSFARLDRSFTEIRTVGFDSARGQLVAAKGEQAPDCGQLVARSAHPGEILGTPLTVRLGRLPLDSALREIAAPWLAMAAAMPASAVQGAANARRLVVWTAGHGRERELVTRLLAENAASDSGTGTPAAAGKPYRTRMVAALGALPVLGAGRGGAKARDLDEPEVRWVSDLHLVALDVAGQRRWTPVGVVQLGSFRDAATLEGTGVGALTWQVRTWSPTSIASATIVTPDHHAVGLEHRGNGMDLVLGVPLARAQGATWHRSAATSAAPTAAYAPPAVATTASDYAPGPTLRPYRWTPIVEAGAVGVPVDPATVILGADLGGRDALSLATWALTLRSDLAFTQPTAFGSLTIERWRPQWALAAALLPGVAYTRRGFFTQAFATRAAVLRLSGALVIPQARGGFTASASLRLARTRLRDSQEDWRARTLRDEPFGPAPRLLRLTGAGDLSASFGWSRTEVYPNSLVAERVSAWALAATWAEPLLGESARALRLDLDGRRSFRLGDHRVLSLRGRLGHGVLVPQGRVPYQVAGTGPSDVTQLIQGVGGADFGAVRGLLDPRRGERLLAGRSLVWLSAQLHLPLGAIGHGFDTLPLWLGRLWWTPFVDAAGVLAGDEARLRDRATTSGVVASIGAEIRLGLESGYQALGTLRLGAAAIVGANGGWSTWVRLGE